METSLRPRVRDGDPVAFGTLFDQHARLIHRHPLRWTGGPGGRRGRGVADLPGGLTSLEAWRRDRDQRACATPPGPPDATSSPGPRMPPQATVPDFADDLVARVADREHLMAARAALQLLIRPSVWFSRCAWAGLDHTQVSQALRVPVGTVRSRLSRARTRLRGLTEQELARSAKPGGKARQRQPGSG